MYVLYHTFTVNALFLIVAAMQILFTRSHPAADMALRLVHVQHLARLVSQSRIDL